MQRHEALHILNKTPDAWNDTRRGTLGSLPALDLATFSGRLLLVDLSGLNLSKATFQAEVTGSDFSGANLQKATFVEHCQAGQADFSRAHMDFAVLRNCSLSGAVFLGARLVGADLSGCDLKQASFVDADLRGADLRGADLRHADLTNARVSGVRFDRQMKTLGVTIAEVRGNYALYRCIRALHRYEELRATSLMLALLYRVLGYGRGYARFAVLVSIVVAAFSSVYVGNRDLVNWDNTFVGGHSCEGSPWQCGQVWGGAVCYTLANMMTLSFAAIPNHGVWGAAIAVLNALVGFFLLGLLAATIFEGVLARE